MKADGLRPLPRPSRAMLAWFSIYLRWYVPRHFRALRIAHAARFLEASHNDNRPLIVALNHPSWWDPLTCILVSRVLLPTHDHYAPMDAAEAERYRILRHMGLFPVEQHSTRGAVQFLRASQQILSRPRSVLWITPQGAFTDVRSRPLQFRAGLSALVTRLPQATVIPLAIEYSFWNERLPEILVNCGTPVAFFPSDTSRTQESVDARLTSALAATQDELMEMALTRDSGRFQTLLEGSRGMGNIHSLWQHLRAGAAGHGYSSEHGKRRLP